MIQAIHDQRQARCSLDLAIHVLEVMEGIIKLLTIDSGVNLDDKK